MACERRLQSARPREHIHVSIVFKSASSQCHGHSIDRMGLAGRWTMLNAADMHMQDAKSSGRFGIGCKTVSIL